MFQFEMKISINYLLHICSSKIVCFTIVVVDLFSKIVIFNEKKLIVFLVFESYLIEI